MLRMFKTIRQILIGKNQRPWLLLIYFLPILTLFIYGLLKFGSIPFSSDPPTWGDGIEIFVLLLTFLTFILFYISIEAQEIQSQLNVIDQFINSSTDYIDTIHFGDKSGIDAIVEYGKKYNSKSDHPRVVIDKTAYLIGQIKFYAIALTEMNSRQRTEKHLVKLCLFFYHHLYFSVGKGKLDDEQSTFLERLNSFQYGFLVSNFLDLQKLTYEILKERELVQKHKESEVFYSQPFSDPKLNRVKDAFAI